MKTQNPWMGRVKGTAGQMTGCKVYDKNVFRAKAFEVNNPKTNAQTTERDFFAQLMRCVAGVSEDELRALFGTKPKAMSRRNSITSQLSECFTIDGLQKDLDFSKAEAIGNNKRIPVAMYHTESVQQGQYELEETAETMGLQEGSQANFVMVIFNQTQGRILIVVTDMTLDSQDFEPTLYGCAEGDDIYYYPTCNIKGASVVSPSGSSFIIKTRKEKTGRNIQKNTPKGGGSSFLTFTAEDANSSVGLLYVDDNVDRGGTPKPVLEYSSDNGATWESYTLHDKSQSMIPVMITLSSIGDKVMFRGTNSAFSQSGASEGHGAYVQCVMTGGIRASGDVTSLLNGVGGDVALADSTFYSLFKNCTSLYFSPNLPSTRLAKACYASMFEGCVHLSKSSSLPAETMAQACYLNMYKGCSNLVPAPSLPATTLATSCYENMFYGCSLLPFAPELPAMTMAEACYKGMFGSCSNIRSAPSLPATTLAASCYEGMFGSCSNISVGPSLPATTLAASCYKRMFGNCENLSSLATISAETLAQSCCEGMYTGCTNLSSASVPNVDTLAIDCYKGMFAYCTDLVNGGEMSATHLAAGCYDEMFSECTGLTQVTFATINESVNVFHNDSQLTMLIIKAVTPPAIAANTLDGLNQDCYIYVPNGSLADYQAATYWDDWKDNMIESAAE